MKTVFSLVGCLVILLWSLVRQIKSDLQFVSVDSTERTEAKAGTYIGVTGTFLTILLALL